jgi:hypothetical protein
LEKKIGSILRFYDEKGTYCLDSTCTSEKKVKFSCRIKFKLSNLELFRLSPKTGTGDLNNKCPSTESTLEYHFPLKNKASVVNILDQILSLKKLIHWQTSAF